MSSSSISVRLFNGAVRDYDEVETVDELRKLVAQDLHVPEPRVMLIDGLLVLRVNIPLHQLDSDSLLTAAVVPLPFLRSEVRWLLNGQFKIYNLEGFPRHAYMVNRLPDADGDLRQWLCAMVLRMYVEVMEEAEMLKRFCTRTTCPCMRAGRHVTYRWAEPEDRTPPRDLSAPDYIAALLKLAHRTIGGPGFTLEEWLPITKAWLDSVKMLLKRFFRVYAHAYCHHLQEITDAGLLGGMNFNFKHLYFFVREFDLVDARDMAVLKPFITLFEREVVENPFDTLQRQWFRPL